MTLKKKGFLLLLDELIEAEPGTLTGAEVLKDVDGWDSLAVIQFITLVDEQFGTTLAAERIVECKTVDDLIALLGDQIVM